MPTKQDWQAALALCSVLVGAGFASGREIVSFFSCFGGASHLGTAAAASGIGALVYVVMLLSAQRHSSGFPALYGALMGPAAKDAMLVLSSLLCLIVSASMLSAGAELGALAFPIRHARMLGLLLTLLLALASVCAGFHTLSFMGSLLIPVTIAYFIPVALCGRSAPPFCAQLLLPALPMGLIYASFSGALASETICISGAMGAHPARTAYLTSAIVWILLSCANCAMLRAGDVVMQMNLPSVALAAQWGVPGYYSCIIVLWLSVLSTLCALMHSLKAHLKNAGLPKGASVIISAAAPALFSIFGFEHLVTVAYPVLGWICGVSLTAMMLFLPGRDE